MKQQKFFVIHPKNRNLQTQKKEVSYRLQNFNTWSGIICGIASVVITVVVTLFTCNTETRIEGMSNLLSEMQNQNILSKQQLIMTQIDSANRRRLDIFRIKNVFRLLSAKHNIEVENLYFPIFHKQIEIPFVRKFLELIRSEIQILENQELNNLTLLEVATINEPWFGYLNILKSINEDIKSLVVNPDESQFHSLDIKEFSQQQAYTAFIYYKRTFREFKSALIDSFDSRLHQLHSLPTNYQYLRDSVTRFNEIMDRYFNMQDKSSSNSNLKK